MREITNHRTGGGMDEHVSVKAMDEPGGGGANHAYIITVASAASVLPVDDTAIKFQQGPLAEAGINGITN